MANTLLHIQLIFDERYILQSARGRSQNVPNETCSFHFASYPRNVRFGRSWNPKGARHRLWGHKRRRHGAMYWPDTTWDVAYQVMGIVMRR